MRVRRRESHTRSNITNGSIINGCEHAWCQRVQLFQVQWERGHRHEGGITPFDKEKGHRHWIPIDHVIISLPQNRHENATASGRER